MKEGPPSPARLEAFSDGVIAVIITVMVLEIKVPEANGWPGLRKLSPAVLIYLLSFAFTGIYWLNHQEIVRRVDKAAHAMQCANLGFLFCLSLLPLSTAYAVDKDFSGFAVSIYAVSLVVSALSFLFLRLAVHSHLSRHQRLAETDRTGLQNHIFSMGLYVISIVTGYYYPKWTLAGIALLTLLWAFPNMSFSQVKRQSHDET